MCITLNVNLDKIILTSILLLGALANKMQV